MSRALIIAVPFVSAAVLPAVVSCLYFVVIGAKSQEVGGLILLAFLVSSAHVALLGIPAVLLLLWRDCLRWWSVTTAGFIAGALPIAVLTWPVRHLRTHAGSIENGVVTMIDGAPTLAGWLRYSGGLLFFGALGAMGAATYWLARRQLMRSNNRWRGP